MHEFHKFWIEEDPMDIMEFNRVREKFRKRIIRQLQNPDMALCPHFAASEGLINMQSPTLVLTDTPEHCLIVMLDPCLAPSSHTECTVIVCMPFGTVFSSLGHNYQIPRYHYFWSICHPVTVHIVALCSVTFALTPRYGESFLFFQIVFLPLVIQH